MKNRILAILLIFTASLAFYGLGCKGGPGVSPGEVGMEGVEGVEGQGAVAEDLTLPTISQIIPPDRSSISKSQEIVVKFSKTMDPATLVLDGSMASESEGGVWSSSENENDTLTISPKSTWPLGMATLSVTCNDSSGNPSPKTELNYAVHVVFVKVGETGDGTMDSPMGNINDAITQAINTWPIPSEVHVAHGVYEVLSGTSHIILEEGVSILGGFTAENWAARDPSTNTTIIKDTGSTGGGQFDPNCALEAAFGITADTVIDGFKIIGGSGDYSSAICSHDNTGPTIANNIIEGGSGTKIAIGIFMIKSSSKIHNNTIFGTSGNTKIGIGIMNYTNSATEIFDNTISGVSGTDLCVAIFNIKSSPKIYNNKLEGCTAKAVCGITNVESSSPMIYNNIIDAGIGTNQSSGITATKSSPKIYNNTIDGGLANESYGIRIFDDGHPHIINNIIFTSGGAKRYGIYEYASSSDPAELKNNDVFDCPTALYYDDESGKGLKWFGPCIVCCPSFSSSPPLPCNDVLTTPGGANNVGNFSMDPKFEGPDDWHLSATSPKEVTKGGLDLSAEFNTDKDGDPRTPPWSIGAYEYD
ncbi:MAG: right-handed parallel beta-helix repeat-containing protein [Pseudomonadota bacterium]